MTDHNLTMLEQEWTTLQNQSDSYEKLSLLIKLINIVITLILLLEFKAGYWALFICLTLWLQDGIWKTFQSRMTTRIEKVENAIEKLISSPSTTKPAEIGMQFNTAWNESRPNSIGLIIEYIKQALKPTVAYPHVLLAAATLIKIAS